MAVLIDTSFLLALADRTDRKHALATEAMRIVKAPRVVPIPVLPESFYMIGTRVGYQAAIRFFDRMQSGGFDLQPLSSSDMTRMSAIMKQYADNQFDFVDAAIMAIAERLSITRVLTFDRNDFRTFRPTHCDFLELSP